MFDRLKAFVRGGDAEAGREKGVRSQDELHLAAAALMMEAAGMDGRIRQEEHDTIHAIMRERFDLDEAEAEELLAEGRRAADRSTQLYDILRVIRQRLTQEERVMIMEMIWEVAYADGTLHDYEAQLARRIAGLLYVHDRDSGAARKRVVARLAKGGEAPG